MGEVTWTARRVSDGVLVDVTADVDGAVGGVPVQNPIEGGGGAFSVVATIFGEAPTAPGYQPWGYGVLKIVRLA